MVIFLELYLKTHEIDSHHMTFMKSQELKKKKRDSQLREHQTNRRDEKVSIRQYTGI